MNTIQTYLKEREEEFIKIFTIAPFEDDQLYREFRINLLNKPKVILAFNRETIQNCLKLIRERMAKKPTTSNYSTADLIQTSSTGLEMERNKGFNHAIDVLDQLLEPILEDTITSNTN